MVEILPGQEGMVHISEMANYRVNAVSDIVKIGDVVKVKVIKIDEKGRVNLSIKALLPKSENGPSESNYGNRDDNRKDRKFFKRDHKRF
jgi:polyribonucleotide nucleotidyltransferase